MRQKVRIVVFLCFLPRTARALVIHLLRRVGRDDGDVHIHIHGVARASLLLASRAQNCGALDDLPGNLCPDRSEHPGTPCQDREPVAIVAWDGGLGEVLLGEDLEHVGGGIGFVGGDDVLDGDEEAFEPEGKSSGGCVGKGREGGGSGCDGGFEGDEGGGGDCIGAGFGVFGLVNVGEERGDRWRGCGVGEVAGQKDVGCFDNGVGLGRLGNRGGLRLWERFGLLKGELWGTVKSCIASLVYGVSRCCFIDLLGLGLGATLSLLMLRLHALHYRSEPVWRNIALDDECGPDVAVDHYFPTVRFVNSASVRVPPLKSRDAFRYVDIF